MVAKYEIRKAFWHKNHVMLLSVNVPTLTGTANMWSTHEWPSGIQVPKETLIDIFQKEHEKQIDRMIIEEYMKEPQEFKDSSIEDQTNRQ